MQKWEYLVLWFTKDDHPDAIQGIFNDWGSQGWELVAVAGRPGHPDINQAFFKREKVAQRDTSFDDKGIVG